MSSIADALAKAKQRADASAPFAQPAADTAQQLARARRHQLAWIGLLSFAALGAAVLIWQQLRLPPASPAASPQVAPAAVPAASAPAVAPSVATFATPAPAASSTPLPSPSDGAVPSAPAPAPTPAPNAATAQAVQDLVISAVLPGERPRLMFQGRIVSVGESVAPGVVFAGVREQHVIFTDARGAIYERKY